MESPVRRAWERLWFDDRNTIVERRVAKSAVGLRCWQPLSERLWSREVATEHAFVGAFSEGRMTISETDADFGARLQSALHDKVPLQRKLMEVAWQRFIGEDYAGTIIYAALAIERALIGFLRAELKQRGAGTDSQIDKVLEDTSNRLLCTVLLGAVGVGDAALRDRLGLVFNGRNSLAHGKRSGAERDEARSALDVAEAFLTVVGAIPAAP